MSSSSSSDRHTLYKHRLTFCGKVTMYTQQMSSLIWVSAGHHEKKKKTPGFLNSRKCSDKSARMTNVPGGCTWLNVDFLMSFSMKYQSHIQIRKKFRLFINIPVWYCLLFIGFLTQVERIPFARPLFQRAGNNFSFYDHLYTRYVVLLHLRILFELFQEKNLQDSISAGCCSDQLAHLCHLHWCYKSPKDIK